MGVVYANDCVPSESDSEVCIVYDDRRDLDMNEVDKEMNFTWKIPYKNGKINGIAKAYKNLDDDEPFIEISYVDGIKDGLMTRLNNEIDKITYREEYIFHNIFETMNEKSLRQTFFNSYQNKLIKIV